MVDLVHLFDYETNLEQKETAIRSSLLKIQGKNKNVYFQLQEENRNIHVSSMKIENLKEKRDFLLCFKDNVKEMLKSPFRLKNIFKALSKVCGCTILSFFILVFLSFVICLGSISNMSLLNKDLFKILLLGSAGLSSYYVILHPLVSLLQRKKEILASYKSISAIKEEIQKLEDEQFLFIDKAKNLEIELQNQTCLKESLEASLQQVILLKNAISEELHLYFDKMLWECGDLGCIQKCYDVPTISLRRKK